MIYKKKLANLIGAFFFIALAFTSCSKIPTDSSPDISPAPDFQITSQMNAEQNQQTALQGSLFDLYIEDIVSDPETPPYSTRFAIDISSRIINFLNLEFPPIYISVEDEFVGSSLDPLPGYNFQYSVADNYKINFDVDFPELIPDWNYINEDVIATLTAVFAIKDSSTATSDKNKESKVVIHQTMSNDDGVSSSTSIKDDMSDVFKFHYESPDTRLIPNDSPIGGIDLHPEDD